MDRSIYYKNAVGNANTPMGSNITYFWNKYGIEVNSIFKNITNLVSVPKLSTGQLIVIPLLRDLLDIKNNACTLDNFSEEDIDMLIREVATRRENIQLQKVHIFICTYIITINCFGISMILLWWLNKHILSLSLSYIIIVCSLHSVHN